MKNCIYILLVVLFSSCFEEKVKQVPVVEGRIENCTQKEIFLYKNDQPSVPVDTISVSTEGLFKVYKESVSEPGFYHLKLKDKHPVLLFLLPTNFVSLQFNEEQIRESCVSNNSKLSNAIWALQRNTSSFGVELDKLTRQLKELSGLAYNDSVYNHLKVQRDSLIQHYKKQSIQISKKVKSPVIDFLMLNQKYGNISLFSLEGDLQLFLNNAELLMKDAQLKHVFSAYDQELMTVYSSIRAEQRYDAGGQFPALKARTNWDEEVPLSKINGKPLHIVFWTGADLSDEEKMAQVKKMNLRYARKGLKTLMVAFQKDKEVWLQSIKDHKLPFWHLVDTTALESVDLSEMGVRALPVNFIVDTTGAIINRDVWGKDLQVAIDSYLKKY
ncbi:redoxin domain-containing protein [Labilibacter sediminis]|nr:redoxin domain-containing protein [Labilibacter sediminis]